ncbi:MAG: PspC domain-containing protein [Bacteroidota bacterium]|nr:PspC domain-containing protein [Bacteroidota bacterium]
MKKTVIVNISGIIFHIDEDAYVKLNLYIEALHRYFDTQSEGKEIVADIESRIAELFQPCINDAKQSVTIDDVEMVIATLGQPEDIAESATEEEAPEPQAPVQPKSGPLHKYRKLYRDTDHSVIGGVCSGIGAYFAIDPVIIRVIYLLFLASALFTPIWFHHHGAITATLILSYVVLWIIMPEARTSAQKLEMRGEQVTVDNIGKSVKEDFRQKESDEMNSGYRLRNQVQKGVGMAGSAFQAVFTVIRILLGIFLAGFSVVLLVSLMAVLFNINNFHCELFNTEDITLIQYLSHIMPSWAALSLIILGVIGLLIPLFWLLYAGIKLIFRFKVEKQRRFMIPALIIWVVAVISFAVIAIGQVTRFQHEISDRKTVQLQLPAGKTLTLAADSLFPAISHTLSNSDDFQQSAMFSVTGTGKDELLYAPARLSIEESDNDKASIEIEKYWQNRNRHFDPKVSQSINFNYTVTDSAVKISPIFWTSSATPWRFYRLKFKLKLPAGTKIYIDNSLRNILYYAHTVESIGEYDMIGKTWLMTKDGLIEDKSEHLTSALRKTIVVWQNHLANIKSADIEALRNSVQTNSLDTDSGKIVYGVPRLVFSHWKKDYIDTEISEQSKNEHWHKQQNDNYRREFAGLCYGFQLKDSLLYINPVWYAKSQPENIKRQIVVTVYIPEGVRIFFSSEVAQFLKPSDQHLINRTWTTTYKGFKEVEKK